MSASPPPSVADVAGSFGETEVRPMSKIQALTAKAMTRAWTTIPHVTHHDALDVTALELARKRANAGAEIKRTLLPYVIKAVAATLQEHPLFNAALDEAAGQLIVRKYVHIGMATETPKGLMVAVLRDCDAKSVAEIGAETASLAERARTKGLTLAELSGSGFTISSLGSLGGAGFTPIVNAPEVAILGLSRLTEKPTRGANDEIVWRDHLPVSLSYDHRVINGAGAGRFLAALERNLAALAGA